MLVYEFTMTMLFIDLLMFLYSPRLIYIMLQTVVSDFALSSIYSDSHIIPNGNTITIQYRFYKQLSPIYTINAIHGVCFVLIHVR